MTTTELLAEVRAITARMLEASADLEGLQWQRSEAARRARDAGATLYQIAQALGVKHEASALRVLRKERR